MASGINAIANLLGKVSSGNALVVTLDGGAAAASYLNLDHGSVTVNTQPTLDATVTWNAGAVTFTALKLDVTDTASASASLLLDLQVGAVSKFSVTKGGAVTAAGNISAGSNALLGAALVLGSGGRVAGPADGVVLLSNTGITDFGRLQFGGTTSSFPAIKRTSTALLVRLADDSDMASAHAKLYHIRTPATVSTDGNVTHSTANILGGAITRDNLSSNRVDAFPTAADLVAAIPGCVVGTSFDVLFNNNDTAQTLTVNGASTGITYEGAATAIAATECRMFRVVITNVTGAAEAATVYQVV